jgi:hypothetical protein
MSWESLSVIEYTHCIKEPFYVPEVVKATIMVRKFLSVLMDCLKLNRILCIRKVKKDIPQYGSKSHIAARLVVSWLPIIYHNRPYYYLLNSPKIKRSYANIRENITKTWLQAAAGLYSDLVTRKSITSMYDLRFSQRLLWRFLSSGIWNTWHYIQEDGTLHKGSTRATFFWFQIRDLGPSFTVLLHFLSSGHPLRTFVSFVMYCMIAKFLFVRKSR